MKFIEDHAGHPVQAWIALQLPQKQAVGEHLDARGGRHAAFQAHAVAHPLAHSFSELCSDALCGGLGRQPPRLEHEDAPAAFDGL